MLGGFKKFLLRGNVVDLAVAVVVGAAFTAIVTAFTNKIIQPLIAVLGGDHATAGLGFKILKDNPATFLDFGAVISAAINFILVAAIIYFFIVLPLNTLTDLRKTKEIPESEAPPSEIELLEQIRDLLAAQTKAASAQGGLHAAAPEKSDPSF
ncbi:large-conductance mechanosensitive channel protein MscL [Segniliparus rugosus]|uniref:Large-conductance mechanosensitive channel n=1 Tax=Segniliparus rugosus (strain ATCC BAA-974 / DSM 45345 / CCUG 50838 / CIP 108380 / JCM 13579 / CDC 945) TaxID=679197 RepID=E5XN95_SEGRC|nr:large-conductance mechanosensitive channel protein MscL [Segniliparus rugosus]EFV14191.2 large conductance mechanosensitive channel protein [Segniliparus rugosus ATCC BAA-974]